ncbi:MAG: hypothetical protein JO267_00780 [Alphaproteobacteria bacterium]|nr:hypothetical protein [Alphaproteobacteria bacterium]
MADFTTNEKRAFSFPSVDGAGSWLLSGGRSQTPQLSLVVSMIFAQVDVGEPVTVWASLEGSQVNPGQVLDNADDAVGYFQQKIDVMMTLGTDNNHSVDYFGRLSDGPPTFAGTGAVTSSVSLSISASLNAGFFGDQPTGGVGAGATWTDSHSFSATLADFEVHNHSDSKAARHSYVMSESTGGKYLKPEDLIPDLGFTDRFKPIKLYRPPPLATDNFPLMSQIIWQARDLTYVFRPHKLFITVKQSVAWVTATNNFFEVDPGSLTAAAEWTQSVDIPLQDYDHKTI